MTETTIPDTMKAVRLYASGEVDSITVDETRTPIPGTGEVLIKVHAAAITRDELTWSADRLPAIPSYELSGTIVALGDGVTALEPGQDVYAMTGFDRDGVAAEYATVPVGEISTKPETLSHIESAAIPLPALSAMQGLFDHGHLTKNERVLIHGGAGGVGAYAVQLARLHGAYVIATASGPRVDVARSLGADEVIDHTARSFTDIEPVDLVFDTAGGERLERSVEVLGQGGRLVSVVDDPPATAAEQEIQATWFLVQPNTEQLTELALLADKSALRVVVERTYPLGDARRAFAYLMQEGGTGKVVLSVVED